MSENDLLFYNQESGEATSINSEYYDDESDDESDVNEPSQYLHKRNEPESQQVTTFLSERPNIEKTTATITTLSSTPPFIKSSSSLKYVLVLFDNAQIKSISRTSEEVETTTVKVRSSDYNIYEKKSPVVSISMEIKGY